MNPPGSSKGKGKADQEFTASSKDRPSEATDQVDELIARFATPLEPFTPTSKTVGQNRKVAAAYYKPEVLPVTLPGVMRQVSGGMRKLRLKTKESEDLDRSATDLEEEMSNSEAKWNEMNTETPKDVYAELEKRETILHKCAEHSFRAREMIRHVLEAKTDDANAKKEMKFLLKEVSRIENGMTEMRYMHTVEQARLKMDICHTPRATLAKAYMTAIAGRLNDPKGAELILKEDSRSSEEQQDFRKRLFSKFKDPNSPEDVWCPITRRHHNESSLIAAHVVPHAIGVENAAYIFGYGPDKGYEIICAAENGIPMPKTLESAFDDAQFVIVPDPADISSFRIVVLDQELLKPGRMLDRGNPRLPTWEQLNGSQLKWPKDSKCRPKRQFLYLNFLLALFRRRRANVPGWQMDREKFPPAVWATPDRWLRKGFLLDLAKEVGDMSLSDSFLKQPLATFSGPNESPTMNRKAAIAFKRTLDRTDVDSDSEL
jgi:hypothetical protein